MGAAAAKLTGGRGVDHILEIGGSGTLPESINATRNGGHIALIGVLAGYAGPVPTVAIMGKQLKVQGLTVGSRRHQLDMIRAIDVAGYRPVLDKHFPWKTSPTPSATRPPTPTSARSWWISDRRSAAGALSAATQTPLIPAKAGTQVIGHEPEPGILKAVDVSGSGLRRDERGSGCAAPKIQPGRSRP
uniref:Zinc-binding dehydrogenase n=1 Tax=Phenylobacterium glaciei TaxID=2803784 RepID=A0A974P669_9CAUL|nr:zinc-binding dehydrogenase [Phenylobacterium glaciei]